MTTTAPITGPTNKGCYCLCSVAHHANDDVCQPSNAVTTRDVNGRPVQMCGPCAAAHDARHKPKAKPKAAPAQPDPYAELSGLDAQLMRRAETMTAGDADQMRRALAFIREAWAGNDGYPGPADALAVIRDAAADAVRLLGGEPAGPLANGSGPVIFRKAGV